MCESGQVYVKQLYLQGIWRRWALSSKLKTKQKNKICVPVQNIYWAVFISAITQIIVLIFFWAPNSVSMFLCHTVISFLPFGILSFKFMVKVLGL